jgi:hypothetical protein
MSCGDAGGTAVSTLETKTNVAGVTSSEVFDFLANPNDRDYQRWWPGVHLELHMISRADGQHLGDVVLMHEYVGERRVRLRGIVVEAVSGKRLVWQLKAGIRLPVWLSLDLADTTDGAVITHRVRAGWAGWRRHLDPLLRLYLSKSFSAALDAHVRTELRLLGERLREARSMVSSRSRSSDAS